ncbi:MAG: type II toxin-antitoxin system VapC family toxin [Thermoguttaceae bacterium]
MPLDVPDGQRCFVDANILYYCFVETPPFSVFCRQFLTRVQDGNVVALTDVRAISDCVHKVILAEVSHRFGRTRDGLVGWLKQHREALADLPKTAQACGRLLQLRLSVVRNDFTMLPTAVAIAQQHQLLLNDAGIVAQMQRHGVTHLATNDDDFDRVPGVTVWKPRPCLTCAM